MQGIDLKHTTKAELYRMLQSLKTETEKRVEILNDEAIKANVEYQRLRRERDNLRIELDRAECREQETAEMLKNVRAERDDYFKSYQWCILHPWKNLWKNLVKQ